MILKCPISIPAFLSALKQEEGKIFFDLVLTDLLWEHGVLEPEPFGLQLVRKAIGGYEQKLPAPVVSSKVNMPFFRENQLRLIGPELIPFACSLFEETTTYVPSENTLWLYLDSEDLIDWCLGENLSLVHCKYSESEWTASLISQLKQEYNKIFFDDEHTGFLPGSHFVSVLYRALFEGRPDLEQGNKEWRITTLVAPADADYAWNGTSLKPYKTVQIPVDFVRQIEMYPDYRNDPALYTALIGALKKVGLTPESLLIGLME